MARKYCMLCKKEIARTASMQFECKDGTICYNCYSVSMFMLDPDVQSNFGEMTYREIEEAIDKREAEVQAAASFPATSEPCPLAKFNDTTRKALFYDSFPKMKAGDGFTFVNYEDIKSFDFVEESLSEGELTGRAAMNGVMLGGLAAVATSSRNIKYAKTKLQIRITLVGRMLPTVFVNFIDMETNFSKSAYEECMAMVEATLLKLESIVNSNASRTVERDLVEEIRRYKALMDERIITEEEFERKKRQLLEI